MSKLLMNAVNCEVPYRYIRETMTGVSEAPIADQGQEEETIETFEGGEF